MLGAGIDAHLAGDLAIGRSGKVVQAWRREVEAGRGANCAADAVGEEHALAQDVAQEEDVQVLRA